MPIINSNKLAAVCIVASVPFLVYILLAMTITSKPAPPKPKPVIADAIFNDVNVAKKTDRLVSIEPHPVEPVVVPAPQPVPTPAPPRAPVVMTASYEPSHESNICTRHGLRKVVTRGGRSWRCRH